MPIQDIVTPVPNTFELFLLCESEYLSPYLIKSIHQHNINFYMSNVEDPELMNTVEYSRLINTICKNPSINDEIMDKLIEYEINFNTLDSWNQSALHSLCKNPSLTKYMLLQLKEIGPMLANFLLIDDDKISPVYYLCSSLNLTLDTIDFLFELFPINNSFYLLDDFEESILHYIFSNSKISPDLIRKLIERGLSFDCKGSCNDTPLHMLFKKNYVTYEIICAFLCPERLHPFYIENNYGETPLHPFYIENNYGETPLHHLLENEVMTPMILQKLIDSHIRNFEYKSTKIENPGNEQNTPLHFLFRNINLTIDIVEILFQMNYNINLLNRNKETPLHYYCSSDNFKIDIFLYIVKEYSFEEERGSIMITNIICKDIRDNTSIDLLCKNPDISKEVIKELVHKRIIKKENFNLCISNHKDMFSDDEKKEIYNLFI